MAQDPLFDVADLALCAAGAPAAASWALRRAVGRVLEVAAGEAGRGTDGSQGITAVRVETALPGATGIGTKRVARREWQHALVRTSVARFAVLVVLVLRFAVLVVLILVLVRLPVLVAVMPTLGALVVAVTARLPPLHRLGTGALAET